MKQLKNRIIVVVLLNLVGVKSFAYDFSVENNDGVTIYYNYVNDGKELEVTCLKCSYYRGDSSNGFSVHVHEGYEGVEKIIGNYIPVGNSS